MFIKSELKTREHCDSIRQQVDLAREIAIENIHKASNALMSEIDAYERECLSSWTATKESNEVIVEDVSKRTSAFLLEQQEYLQSVKSSDDELIVYMYEAKQLARELSDRKKELKAAMFDNILVSFIAFPSFGVASLGELAFTDMQLPFKTLDINIRELTPVDIRVDFHYLLPLEHGERIVAFKLNADFDYRMSTTSFICFDGLGRQIGRQTTVESLVERQNVALCASNEFVVCHGFDSMRMLSFYDSELHCLRTVHCKVFWNICCNSKFIFGKLDTDDSNETVADNDDNDNDNDEQQADNSTEKIQVLHLDTLSEAFELRVPKKYRIEQIMADEHRVVTIIELASEPNSHDRFMSIFDLATCDESGGSGGDTRASGPTYFLAEKTIDLAIDFSYKHFIILFDGWLVFPHEHELVWFDKKNGTRSETRTEWDSENVIDIYSFGSSIIFEQRDGKLLLKR